MARRPRRARLDDERRALLRQTLAHAAARVPYYRARIRPRWLALEPELALARLPVLIKDDVRAHGRQLVADGTSAFTGVVSSGTTRGAAPLVRIPRTDDERRAFASDARAPRRRPRSLVLEVRALQHGLPEGPPAEGRLAVPWTDTAQGLELIRSLLAEPQADGRRVRAMTIGAAPLMVLTAWLVERGVEPASLGVRAIGTTGLHLADAWRTALRRTWRAALVDNYSLSEIATPAIECETCGHMHWLRPPVVAEVLELGSLRPLLSGTGALVVTTLFPFVQAMPLLRYETGDLVTLGPRCAVAGERGFRVRGRLTHCIVDHARGANPIVVSAQDVQEHLAEAPEVARVAHPAHRLGLVRADVGPAKIALSGDARAPRVTVELRFEPTQFPRAVAALTGSLRAHLRARGAPVSLVIEAVAPGGVERPLLKH